MNKILFNYVLSGFFKTILKVVFIFYCFGIILNLFEEIEFFKDLNVPVLTPLFLTALFIPSLIIQQLPFIIFISSMWFLLNIRNNKDLLTLKVFGYSNFKIFFIIAISAFILGWLVLLLVNPLTSSMSKYYEKTKSNYSKDIDHLVTFNKNGLWIKENLSEGQRITTAREPDGTKLKDVTVFDFDSKFKLSRKIFAKTVNILNNNWQLEDVEIYEITQNSSSQKKLEKFELESIYTYEKITSLFKNFDTMSFLDIVLRYQDLNNKGYNKTFLNQKLHSMLSLPFFLFLMTSVASILTMNTLKKSNNFKFIIVGIITSVAIYYFKDLSMALGETNRIPLTLAYWVPIITVGLFSFIGILQINEK